MSEEKEKSSRENSPEAIVAKFATACNMLGIKIKDGTELTEVNGKLFSVMTIYIQDVKGEWVPIKENTVPVTISQIEEQIAQREAQAEGYVEKAQATLKAAVTVKEKVLETTADLRAKVEAVKPAEDAKEGEE